MPVTPDDIRRGEGWLLENQTSFAKSVHYERGRFVLKMKGRDEHHDVRKVIPASSIPPLRDQSHGDLRKVKLTPMGDTMHFESIDVDVYIPAVLSHAV